MAADFTAVLDAECQHRWSFVFRYHKSVTVFFLMKVVFLQGVRSQPVSKNFHYSLLDSLLLAADCLGKGNQKEAGGSPGCLLLMLRVDLRPLNSLVSFHLEGSLTLRQWFKVRSPKPWWRWIVYVVITECLLTH